MPEAKTGDKEQAQGKRKDKSLMQWARLMRDKRISLEKKMHHVSDDINSLINDSEATQAGTGDEAATAQQDYHSSNYAAVFEAIADMDSVFDDMPYCTPDDPTGENHENIFTDSFALKELFILYYFTTRPDIKPSSHDAWGDIIGDSDNIRETYKRFDDFLGQRFVERFIHDGFITEDFEVSDDDLQGDIAAFVKSEHPNGADEIIVKIESHPLDDIIYPVDKVNHSVWKLLEKDTVGQIGIHLEKTGSKTEIMGIYAIDFSGIEDLIEQSGGKITKQLLPFDKRLYIAVDSLYQAGNAYITIPEIYRAMGHNGNPPQREINRIIQSLMKMESAKIYLTNQAEIDAGYNYPLVNYYGSLLPMEFATAEKNGALVNSVVHPLKELTLSKFARDRKQCTRIAPALLNSPISKTDIALAIEDYLLERISRARNDRDKAEAVLKRLQRKHMEDRTDKDNQQMDKLKKSLNKPFRILYETLFAETGIKGAKQQQRAKETIRRLLEWYKEQKFISGHTADAKGISVKL